MGKLISERTFPLEGFIKHVSPFEQSTPCMQHSPHAHSFRSNTLPPFTGNTLTQRHEHQVYVREQKHE